MKLILLFILLTGLVFGEAYYRNLRFNKDQGGLPITKQELAKELDAISISTIATDDTLSEAQTTPPKLTVHIDNVSNPPTDAELDAAIGTPANVGTGYTAIVNDNDAGTNVYFVFSDGTKWWILTATVAA